MRTRTFLRLSAALLTFTLLANACGDDDPIVEADGAADGDMDDSDPIDDMSDGDADGDGHDDDAEDHDGDTAHNHGDDVEFAGAVVPTIAIEVEADPAGGINVHVTSTDFTVNPEAASTDHVEGEGHYHLYVNGQKSLRFYNDSIYFAGVVEGDVEVGVELSANDHRSYAVDGEILRASETFTVPAHGHDTHSHDDPVSVDWDDVDVAIDVTVEEDPESGWNVFVDLSGMTLSPESVNGDHVAGEGHLHIFANGQKLGRLYGTATHISALPEGDVEISVVAYTNDHMPYLLDGQPISAAVTITVPAS